MQIDEKKISHWEDTIKKYDQVQAALAKETKKAESLAGLSSDAHKQTVKNSRECPKISKKNSVKLQLRMSTQDKEKVKKVAELRGFSTVSAYIKHVVNCDISRQRLTTKIGGKLSEKPKHKLQKKQ